MSKKLYFIIIQVILIENAFAYLDPGTWSIGLQILMVAIVGGIAAIKTSWQNIKIFFRNIFRNKSSS